MHANGSFSGNSDLLSYMMWCMSQLLSHCLSGFCYSSADGIYWNMEGQAHKPTNKPIGKKPSHFAYSN